MPAMLMQQGSCGAMRDLDYINPRAKCPPSALPPEIRRKLGLAGPRSASAPPAERDESYEVIYKGAANAAPKVGASGAGTAWQNPNGHAFVRKGSGVPMSKRASRKAQLEGPPRSLLAPGQPGSRLPPSGASLERLPSGGSGSSPPDSAGGGGARGVSRDRRKVGLALPPKAPMRTKSLPGQQ